MHRPFYLVCFLLLFGCSTKDPGTHVVQPDVLVNTFQNPLTNSGPDPWVIQKEGTYYYTHTFGNKLGIYKTKTLSRLRNAENKIIWYPPATGENSKHIWAPELHFLNGKWYMYYTAGSSDDLSFQRSFVLENTSEDPMDGEWIDRGKIYDPEADLFAIDGTVFQLNGEDYFIWSGHESATDNTQQLYIAQMSDPWTLKTSRYLISSPEYPWEKIGDPDVLEGPEILENKDGQIFLIYSASGCWTDDYALGMLTLKDNGNPLEAKDWVKHPDPVFTKKPEHKAYGPGHNGFFKSPDGTEDWIIYHANTSSGDGCKDERSPRMQQFSWNDDGTPNFGEPVNINTPIENPSGETE